MTYYYENTRTGELAAGEKFSTEALKNGWKRVKKRDLLRMAKERNVFILPICKG